MGGTISYSQNISVTISSGCSDLYICTGNLNSALYFPSSLDIKWEVYWTSSIGNYPTAARNPIFMGRSGYSCNDSPSYRFQDPSLLFIQRPALFYDRRSV